MVIFISWLPSLIKQASPIIMRIMNPKFEIQLISRVTLYFCHHSFPYVFILFHYLIDYFLLLITISGFQLVPSSISFSYLYIISWLIHIYSFIPRISGSRSIFSEVTIISITCRPFLLFISSNIRENLTLSFTYSL